MATQITEYKCPCCTAPLHFGEGSGRLECDYCGSSYSVKEMEALNAKEDAKAEEAFAEEEVVQQAPDTGEGSWDV